MVDNITLKNETFEINKEKDYYVIEHPIQPLVGLGLTLEEAIKDLEKDIEYCYEEYVEVDENALTDYEKQFREFLIEYAENN